MLDLEARAAHLQWGATVVMALMAGPEDENLVEAPSGAWQQTVELVDRLWASATPENAREIADRTWDLVHDRSDSDPVKRRVVECHEALARMTRLGD